MEINKILDMCEDVACSAIDGCPSIVHKKIVLLIDKIVSDICFFDSTFSILLKQVLQILYECQRKNDLIGIADCVNYDLRQLICEHKIN